MKTMTEVEREFCANGLLERPRYFPRQLITPAEMTLEQNYFRDKMRRHNRLLHGWGVVCGAKVCLVPNPDKSDAEPWKVAVHPGYILDPFGNEIMIDRERVVDLRTEGLISVCGEPAGEVADPWCSDVFVRRKEEGEDITLYVAVKYKEVLTRPVRVQPAGCGCDDTQCEFSRFCDGYEIGVLNRCPESHEYPPPLDLQELVTGRLLDCPECPTDPWVVLATVRLNSDGVIQEIDNCSCRRIVISFGRFWRWCVSEIINVRFETHIKLYFTALFRCHMLAKTNDRLDLWDRDNVEYNFDTIRDRINRNQNQEGVMPPSSLWGHTWDELTRNRFLKDFDEWKTNGFPA